MNHTDHVNLIRTGVPALISVWADLGSGDGAFTLALADLLAEGSAIFSIGRDRRALDAQRSAMQRQFPTASVTYQVADFTQKLALPPLDGVLMANSLHFVRHKAPVLELVRGYLKPGGRLIMVEYNTDQGNTWVPYPMTFETWATLAQASGFADTRKLSARPSRFLGEIFSALSFNK
jgi:SAM-dependent methyltransferase